MKEKCCKSLKYNAIKTTAFLSGLPETLAGSDGDEASELLHVSFLTVRTQTSGCHDTRSHDHSDWILVSQAHSRVNDVCFKNSIHRVQGGASGVQVCLTSLCRLLFFFCYSDLPG